MLHVNLSTSLEKESGFFFNIRYFEEKVLAGEWDEVEKYLSGFTKVDDNRYSTKIYYDLRKQRYLESLDRWIVISLTILYILPFNFSLSSFNFGTCALICRNDKHQALDILLKDLKVFSTYSSDAYTEISQLLNLDNFRYNILS